MEDDFLDGTYNMTVINNTDQTWVLDEADEVTGPIGPAQVPEPAAGGAALALVGLTLCRRKDRAAAGVSRARTISVCLAGFQRCG